MSPLPLAPLSPLSLFHSHIIQPIFQHHNYPTAVYYCTLCMYYQPAGVQYPVPLHWSAVQLPFNGPKSTFTILQYTVLAIVPYYLDFE